MSNKLADGEARGKGGQTENSDLRYREALVLHSFYRHIGQLNLGVAVQEKSLYRLRAHGWRSLCLARQFPGLNESLFFCPPHDNSARS